MRGTLVLATPHRRFDPVEERLRADGRFEFLRVRTPEGLTREALAAIGPRYVFLPHWSWRIPADVYESFECVVFHMTDVPFGRGGSPLQNLIVRGYADTTLTALRCVEEMDAGPVYLKRPLALLGTAEEILMRAGDLIGTMILDIAATEPEPQPQVGEPVIFRRRVPADGDIAATRSLAEAYDYIRMLDAEGYPNAFAEVGPFRLEFSRASLTPDGIVADVRIRRRENP